MTTAAPVASSGNASSPISEPNQETVEPTQSRRKFGIRQTSGVASGAGAVAAEPASGVTAFMAKEVTD